MTIAGTRIQQITGMILAILIIAMYLGRPVVNVMSPAPAPTPTSEPAKRAWQACFTAVDRSEGLRPEDAEPFRPGVMHLLADKTYAVGIYYAKQAATYTCRVLPLQNGTTSVTGIHHRP